MHAVLNRPACGQCARAAINLFPLCGQAICIECLVAASLQPEPKANLCLCPTPKTDAVCPGRPADSLLPREECYECKASFPISAISSGELQGIGAIYLCNPCTAAMVRKDHANHSERRQARQESRQYFRLLKTAESRLLALSIQPMPRRPSPGAQEKHYACPDRPQRPSDIAPSP